MFYPLAIRVVSEGNGFYRIEQCRNYLGQPIFPFVVLRSGVAPANVSAVLHYEEEEFDIQAEIALDFELAKWF